MKRIFLTGMLLGCIVCASATRRALVIGIGAYPAESGWAQINGDKDIPLVEEMLVQNGFDSKNIVKLKDQQATYAAICQELENLISQSDKDDYVYVHFSGHGQQISDLNGDEKDHFDEAWIPYDAQASYLKGRYEGQNHLVDDQLNNYLHRIRERVGETGKIIVVADACHSGGGTRSLEAEAEMEGYVIRGTSDIFFLPAEQKPVAQNAPLYAVEWTFISACLPQQCNYEYQGKGSLTYALYQLRTDFSTLSAKEIGMKTKSLILNILKGLQTPKFETTVGKEQEIFL